MGARQLPVTRAGLKVLMEIEAGNRARGDHAEADWWANEVRKARKSLGLDDQERLPGIG